MPRATASRGAPITTASPFEPDVAAEAAVDAEDHPGEFGPAGADQPGEAEDLAPAHGEIDRVMGIGSGADTADLQDRLAGRGGGRDVDGLQLAADHQADHRVGRDLVAAEVRRPALPSRSTTTRSAQVVTSLRRWEMKMMLTPAAFSSAITFSSRSVSVSGQARRRLVHDHEARSRARAPWRSRGAAAARATGWRPASRA